MLCCTCSAAAASYLTETGLVGHENTDTEQDGTMYFDDFTTCEATSDTREKPEIQELIRRRDRFIAEHPQLRETQNEIDRLMSNVIDPRVRIEILFMLISEKLTEMKKVFGEVVQLTEMVVSD
ncbi:hypothetical protein EG833_02485 [archaeon]|nr:hypothetical protein [archaeon]